MDGIFNAGELVEDMVQSYHIGKERGTTTHIKAIDERWTWRPTEVTMWTGYQNEGKSLMLEQLCALKSYFDKWGHAIFSPENMPVTDFFDNIIEMYIGKSCDKYYKENLMTEEEYREGIEFVSKYFYIVYPPDEFTIEAIFERFEHLIKNKGVKNIVIDPYNTVAHEMRAGEREDLYISRFMTKLKRFAVKHDVCFQLVAHQLTPQKDDSGRYVRPDVNRIKGGGTFADKADNVNFVWRPERALDFASTEVIFGSQKIKKQKLVGIPGEVRGISFFRKYNRYQYDGFNPFKAIDEARKSGSDASVSKIIPNFGFDDEGF